MHVKRGARTLLALLLLLTLCGCGTKPETEKTVVVIEKKTEAETVPETPAAPAASAEPTAADWYGWWRMKNTSGDWAKMYGYYWDCCAELQERGDGRFAMILWDEDIPKETQLAGAVLEKTDAGFRCLGGSFLDRELAEGDWSAELRQDAGVPLLHIEGDYRAVGKGGFHYEIFLRPWGSRWPGSAEEKPYAYESWYLPLIEAGEPMPDVIGK